MVTVKTFVFDGNPNTVNKTLTEQDGVELVYSNPKGHGPFLHSHDSHGHH